MERKGRKMSQVVYTHTSEASKQSVVPHKLTYWVSQDQLHHHLEKSKSDDWISNKIRILMHEGKPQDQAIAIAYSMAGRSRKDNKVKKSIKLFLRSDLVKSVPVESKEKETKPESLYLKADLFKNKLPVFVRR